MKTNNVFKKFYKLLVDIIKEPAPICAFDAILFPEVFFKYRGSRILNTIYHREIIAIAVIECKCGVALGDREKTPLLAANKLLKYAEEKGWEVKCISEGVSEAICPRCVSNGME